MNKEVRNNCNCRPFGDHYRKVDNKGDLRYCQIQGTKEFNFMGSTLSDQECVDNVFANENILWESEDCDCTLPSCDEKEYDTTLVDVDRPDVYWESLDYDGVNITREYMEKNIVDVTLNYGKLQEVVYAESKAVSVAQLLGNIGGSMGLYLGISIISIFEVIGDLSLMRLLPRLWGHKQLYGLGVKRKDN